MIFLKRYAWLLVIPVLFILVFFLQKDEEQLVIQEGDSIPNEETDFTEADSAAKRLVVDVKGEVARPGIYELEAGLRVNDAISMAGGMTKEADQTSVNLAQKIVDEMVILVATTAPEGSSSSSASSGGGSTGKVRVNQASVEEIQALPGIGPSKAEAIIKHREENSLFKKPEDLLDVSGIGEKTLENMLDVIQVP
ncbi:helix-hairpin-helix domain-containing protein [Halobacillus naozhouensis]|uniref:Helix-hairpin-helix domain-containing protein n=1 Tax=Halobacillus naozhouensis TaxID=554880 RepID=A0ABY8IVS1_9BACI|nr:helix-hairpin-helix domain-containing protein [Halobacillus naozhouensis]WFT73313.1 helix-hairpin-helix domain-containing protein [Halobacillus naozhouensis]